MDYQSIVKYATNNGIDLNSGWMVWVISENSVQLSLPSNGQPFSQTSDAYGWARQHKAGQRLIVTGPEGRYAELEPNDRIPLPLYLQNK